MLKYIPGIINSCFIDLFERFQDAGPETRFNLVNRDKQHQQVLYYSNLECITHSFALDSCYDASSYFTQDEQHQHNRILCTKKHQYNGLQNSFMQNN